MPSTFTTNTGIEKPAQGEQSGSWGITVNTNSDIIDRAINGVVSLALVGTSSNLTTSNGATSDGQNKVLLCSGTLAATHTITILPADAQKVYYVKNDSNRTVTFSQGSGATTANIDSGSFAIIYADGSNNVVNLSTNTQLGQLKQNGVPVTSSAADLNVLDGADATTLEFADLELLDGAVKNTVVAEKAVVYGSSGEVKANKVALGNWTIEESGSDLKFYYSGSPRFKITSSGATVAINDVTAFGSV
tara:strand:- start:1056 stop:1796 length:741 start_codon:yes stop_codon:yes gene_type:complete